MLMQSPAWGPADRPILDRRVVVWPFRCCAQTGREVDMKLVKRFAVALGSLLAVALAGGAHWRW